MSGAATLHVRAAAARDRALLRLLDLHRHAPHSFRKAQEGACSRICFHCRDGWRWSPAARAASARMIAAGFLAQGAARVYITARKAAALRADRGRN
ncbi:MAG: hypothetical protein MZV49_20805 [Rhodopseudomonas palustris]|nr:hypothetical protein [Rhodopseudomonas palustris]